MRFLWLFAAAALFVSPVAAQQAQCWDIDPGTQKTFFNKAMTDRVRAVDMNQDQRVMDAFAGTWVGDNVYPDGSMVDTTWYTFEPNGVFEYHSKTCGNVMALCSQGYGAGGWAALQRADGQVEVVFNFNDLQREAACGALVGLVRGNTMVANGTYKLHRIK